MPHEKVFGVCENKCLVEVMSKAETEEKLKNVEVDAYTKKEIDEMFGTYVDEVADLIGGI